MRQDHKVDAEWRQSADIPASNRLAVPAGEMSPVRLGALRALIGNNEAAARSILRNFIVHSGGVGDQLRAACAAGQAAAASHLAHKLKAAARAIGAIALAELCEAMECAGGRGDTESLTELLTLFGPEEAAVLAFIAMREQDPTPIM